MMTETPTQRKRWHQRPRTNPPTKTGPDWRRYNPPAEAAEILSQCPNLVIASTAAELTAMACGGPTANYFEVAYDVKGKGRVVEATVARVRNGICANYIEPYMRRRDPHCMFIADDQP